MAILFKWNDKTNGTIVVDNGYRGRTEIGKLTRKSGKVNAYVVVGDEAISTITKRPAGEAKELVKEAYYSFMNEEVEVTFINPHTGSVNTATIRRGDKGGACDPSTDRYWTM